jgi:hypothetical protein
MANSAADNLKWDGMDGMDGMDGVDGVDGAGCQGAAGRNGEIKEKKKQPIVSDDNDRANGLGIAGWLRQWAAMKNTTKPRRSPFSVLRQICHLIPAHLVPKLARETGVDRKTRTFSPWSHLVSLIHAQLTHAIGLNDSRWSSEAFFGQIKQTLQLADFRLCQPCKSAATHAHSPAYGMAVFSFLHRR